MGRVGELVYSGHIVDSQSQIPPWVREPLTEETPRTVFNRYDVVHKQPTEYFFHPVR